MELNLALDTRHRFTGEELESIAAFLLNSTRLVETPLVAQDPVKQTIKPLESKQSQCKSCGESRTLTPKSGKYGYFVNCDVCETNTSMKMQCLQCKSKNTKNVRKEKTQSEGDWVEINDSQRYQSADILFKKLCTN